MSYFDGEHFGVGARDVVMGAIVVVPGKSWREEDNN